VEPNSLDDQVAGVAALEHPISRQVYQLACDGSWISRERTADALGLPRSVAAFHLDKLADAGLLDARFERLSGRTGPGAGRPAKLYGRSDRQIDVSIPPRRYDLAGSILASAISRAAIDAVPVGDAVATVARETGERLGAGSLAAKPTAKPTAKPAAVVQLLRRYGYEPRLQGGQITLLNCPFHALAAQHRALVCGMNLDLLTGVVSGIGASEALHTRLAPAPGHCCVRIDAC
jgi:predicted ArsR family transcriptional regulator